MRKEIKRQWLIPIFLVISVLFLSEISQATNKVRVIAKKANVRLRPTIDSDIIATLPLGAVLELERKVDSWYYVKLPKTQRGFVIFGYIYASLVETIEELPKVKKIKRVAKPVIEEVKPLKVEPLHPVKKPIAIQRKIVFKIGGGISLPLSDWSDYYDMGFSISGSIIYPVSSEIDIIGGVEFSRFGGESAEYKYDDYTWKADFSFSRIIFFGDARYTFKGETKFFLEGGLGIYSDKEEIGIERETWREEIEIFSISNSGTNLGIRVGGGIVFSNVEIIGIFHMIENSDMFTFAASFRF